MEAARPGAERTVASTATVAAEPAAVWEIVSDPARFADWADRTEAVTRADSPLRIGSTYEERNKVMGPLTGTSRWTVVQHEPPRSTTHRGEGIALAAAMDFFLALEPDGAGTRLTVGLRYRPGLGPLGALIDRVYMRRSLQASFERTAANIKRLAQGSAD
jgi:carbon monoxide dehydrogenase subunit G